MKSSEYNSIWNDERVDTLSNNIHGTELIVSNVLSNSLPFAVIPKTKNTERASEDELPMKKKGEGKQEARAACKRERQDEPSQKKKLIYPCLFIFISIVF